MLRIIRMGQIPYEEGIVIQKKIQEQRIEGLCEDTLLLLEHPSVMTKGIRTKEEHILVSEASLHDKGIDIHTSNRGGDVTYFGPGQVMGYIIMNIDRKGKDIRRIVQKLEQITLNILKKEFNIEGHTEDKKYTGVFVGDNKITAIGLAVNRRVTMHGFAMNVNTDLSHFDYIVPCGLPDRGVTSIKDLTGRPCDIDQIQSLIIKEFETLFETDTYETDKETLMVSLGV